MVLPMAVGLSGDLPQLHTVKGVRLAAAAAGIRKQNRADVVLIEVDAATTCGAVFTRNAFCAAPVLVARDHLRSASPRYLLINAGNANAGTGAAGVRDAKECCAAVAARAGCAVEEVLPCSTGVIGEPLPVGKIRGAVAGLLDGLQADGWEQAARGIMTTDTVPKAISRRLKLGDATVTLNGIAKGAGMIHPNMATMLAFIATDARVERALLQRCLEHAVERSFHRISVDGDTSTNDACIVLATGGETMAAIASERDPRYEPLREGLTDVCVELAKAIVRDAEGATKFITVVVREGRDLEECRAVAYAVALSPLVKTACFASDPNWGRILAATGRAGLRDFDISRVSIYLDGVCVVRNGERASDYTETRGREAMSRTDITVRIDLGRGSEDIAVWTSDLSYDYVRINAEYRT